MYRNIHCLTRILALAAHTIIALQNSTTQGVHYGSRVFEVG
jgi:hypothetical protein